ncbi:MAG: putative DNA binding domain-containing protein [Bacteroidales bacterium]|nr:putative DNA binding domain-containing protein [Bacteroidales bacterium]
MTIDDIQRLIQYDETRTLEIKKTTGELKDGMRSACAFLNTVGGWVLFGVTPSTLQVLGQQVTENTRREIARELTKIDPVIDIPVEYVDVPGRDGFQVIVMRLDGYSFGDPPFTYDGKPYMRVESTTVAMPRDMFEERLLRNRMSRYPWENQICEDITLGDLDEQRIRGAVRLGVERGRMPVSSLTDSTERLVEELKLTKKSQLKNAAAALFLRDTSDFPQFLLRLARFRGTDKMEFIDNQRAYGNFFTLLDAGMAFFFKHLSLSGKIVGLVREEKLEIPVEALREALTNALCHRQFYSPGGSVGIAIYDDRVVIENIGHLPEELTVETIKTNHQSFARNPLIADVLFKTTFLENWGSGVSRMMDACKEAGLPEPQYGTNGLFVWITFYRPTAQPYNLETVQHQDRTTEQPNNRPTEQPLAPTTSKTYNPTTLSRSPKRLKMFLSIIGDNGANMKTLMDKMQLKHRPSFISKYITPSLRKGYIAMLYPETPNHPMQSYYLTQKGRELLEQLLKEE